MINYTVGNLINKWRAVCAERCKHGSGASVWKPNTVM